MLHLGGAAILGGLGGPAPAQSSPQPAAALPDGVFLPSSDHLGHALMKREPFLNAPAGSQTEFAQPHTGPFRPAFFSASEYEAVLALVRVILGEPARSPAVPEVAAWMDLFLAESAGVREAARALLPSHRTLAAHFYGGGAVEGFEDADPGRICRQGLDWLARECGQRYGASFQALPEKKQTALLGASWQAQAPFLELIKREAIRGFYTSRAGLDDLRYAGNAFYARCPGCEGPSH